MADLLEEGRLRFSKEIPKKRIAYHDPCYLGRHSNVYDAPRKLLASIPGVELIELDRTKEFSLCCAGGGGRIWAEVPKGERFGELRIVDASNKNAEMLTTACPYCTNMLTDACTSLDKQDSLEITELSEVLAKAL